MLSMAIVRLVNGISDAMQQSKFASPVADLADKVSLPQTLVDIRHAATHNALPSLPALLLASKAAALWLRDNYWAPQAAAVAGIKEAPSGAMAPTPAAGGVAATSSVDALSPLLVKYLRARSVVVAARLQGGNPASEKAAEKASGFLLQVCGAVAKSLAKAPLESAALVCGAVAESLAKAPTESAALIADLVAKLLTLSFRAFFQSLEGAREPSRSDEDTAAGYVMDIWDEALTSLTLASPAFLPALRALLLLHLSALASFTRGAASASSVDAPGGPRVDTGSPPERSGRLCLTTSWLLRLGTPTGSPTAAGAAGAANKAAHKAANEAANEANDAVNEAVVRACLAAPCVWTQRLLAGVASVKARGLGLACIQALMDAEQDKTPDAPPLQEVEADLRTWLGTGLPHAASDPSHLPLSTSANKKASGKGGAGKGVGGA
ncbi:Las1-like-domain-containing protein, partial [Baffinella frigidus]